MRDQQLGRLGVIVLCALGGYAAARQTTVPEVASRDALRAGTRVLLDAHNAYVENGGWSDRLDRALATGLPIAIEQDLVWVPASSTAPGRSVVSHGPPVSGSEPTLEDYFFKRIAPLVEEALGENPRDLWPLITLNLDFKTDEPEHHRAIWDVLGRYEKWLVTAQRTAAGEIAPLRRAPLLVLTGEADAQEKSFHDNVPIGGTLRLFGAIHVRPGGLPGARTNYRRWANYPWSAVEPEGQPSAGQWTADDERRLGRLVDAAHAGELWIRFYTLNGHDPLDSSMGWTSGYNFGTLDAARIRWAAAVGAGVDFVATDQYEAFATARESTPQFRTLARATSSASSTFTNTIFAVSSQSVRARISEGFLEYPPLDRRHRHARDVCDGRSDIRRRRRCR